MIHFLRRAVKSVAAKILLAVLIASFAVWGIGDIFTYGGDSAVASVGETEVSSAEYAAALTRTQRALSRQRGQAITLREMVEAGIADATLGSMVREAAFREELNRLEVAVPDEAVRRAIVANPAFQDGQGAFSQFLYQSRISEAGYDPQGYEAAMQQLLGQQLLVDAFTPAVAGLPGAAESIAAHRGEERTVSLLRLTPELAAAPGQPTDAALQAYFEANQERFREPERRTGFYLHTDIAALAEELAPTEEDVRAQYAAHPEAYGTVPTRDVEQLVFDDRQAAESALARIRAGEASFAEVAAEQNVAVADLALGRVTREDLPEASAEAVFGVTEPGVVGPVEGTFGPMLLNVTGVELGGTAPFEDVEGEIRREIAQRRAREAVVQRANAIDDLRAAGTPLPEIAEQVGLELVRFEGLDAGGDVAGGTPPPLASEPAFLEEVFAAMDGEERDVIRLADGSYALVMVEEIVDSHVPALEAVRDRVIEAWAREQRLAALEARARDLAGRIAQEGLAEIAAAEGLTAPETVKLTRETVPPMLSPGLAEAVFAADEGDPLVGRTRTGDAVLLGMLDGITPLPGDALAERAARLDEAIVTSVEQDQLEFLARAIQDVHGVDVNEGAIEQVFSRLGLPAAR